MTKETNLEFKVGGFVLVAIVCLAVFVFSVGDQTFFSKGTMFRAVFQFANGLKISAPVRVAGVECGLVRTLTIFYDAVEKKTKVEVLIWIKEGVRIPKDSKVLINQLGLFGEKYIEIVPGEDQTRFFTPADTIVGQNPVMQEEIAQRILDVAGQVEKGVEGINRIVNDSGNQESIKAMLLHLSEATEKFSRLVDRVEQGEGTVGRLFRDEGIYDDLKGLTADLKANPWKLLYRPREGRTRK